ncbi:hypothetical protein THAOC_17343 [Thalassiosira oceanica]|uniref:Uncharacterized protein n=1 Tax=Thalassiosira oceanica TaxID=159749 RepID=K0SUV0_THAOC|nr:hypothetical protein THAOC_17343 [Thalassiosira oceanica]|eukprot:EJK62062.1 hypothetical protein THAOC_17343 [Thalassiosira oceanica]
MSDPNASASGEQQKVSDVAVATASPAANETNQEWDVNEGKNLGIAMVVLLAVGFICGFFVPIVSLIATIATIVISSTITCGCCGGSGFNLPKNVKRWSNLTLLCLAGMLVLQILYVIGAWIGLSSEVANTGQISTNSANNVTIGALIVGVISWVLNILAFIFACLFTWKRP